MNKSEFVAKLAGCLDTSNAQAEKNLNAVLELIQDTLQAGDGVTFVGFGSFGVKERAAREGRNPATGEMMKIAATTVPYFSAGKKLKNAVKAG